MRASEFITEGKSRKGRSNMPDRMRFASKGLNVFSDAEKINSDYTLNRVMMAVACTDGKTMGPATQHSWIGKYKSAHPYTKEEQEMLKLAYQQVGANWEDLNSDDLESEELESTNSTSPVKPFKGYKK